MSRRGIDKLVTRGRGDHPFWLAVEPANGSSRIDLARAVIDASGTWASHNPLGASGTPAPGEARYSDRIAYGIPDVLGTERAHYAGRRVLVIGGGHSAANALLDLARLADSDRATRLTWALRNTSPARVFGGARADKLAARGKLGEDLRRLVVSGRLQLVTGFRAEHVEEDSGALVVSGIGPAGTVALAPADRIIVATGQRL